MTVLNLCAIVIDVLPSCAASKASWTTYEIMKNKIFVTLNFNYMYSLYNTFGKITNYNSIYLPFPILNLVPMSLHQVKESLDFVPKLAQ